MFSSDDKEKTWAAMIGLSRAAFGYDYSEDLIRTVTDALTNTDDSRWKALTEQVHAQKKIYAPDCAVCAAPCGRTVDYDFRMMQLESAAVQQAKKDLAETLEKTAGKFVTPENFEAVLGALGAIGESNTSERLQGYRIALED